MSILTAEQFARLLDGREYGEEITKEEEAIATESRLFVFFGYGEDRVELHGTINDIIDAREGTEVCIAKTLRTPYWGIINEEMKAIAGNLVKNFKNFIVTIDWCPENLDCSWLITTDIPSFSFDIMEDGDLFCQGIVVAESDVLEHLNSKGSAQ